MNTHGISTRKATVRRSVLLALAGPLAALSLAACSPATTTATTTGATGTTATGTTGSAVVETSSAPGTGPNSSVATTSRNDATLATLIASDDRFTTLNRLVQQAGLAQTLASGEYTIFAPTNDAFLKLSPSDLSAITGDPARLRQVLLYHVVPGRVTGTALSSITRLASVQSGLLDISRSETRTAIGNAGTTAIITPGQSVDTGNGTLYVVESVLLPPTR